MFLSESFEIILEEHEINPIDYDEAISYMDAHILQRDLEAKLEYLYFNQVWEVIKILKYKKTCRVYVGL